MPPKLQSCVQALFCQVKPEYVLNMHDVSNIWQVPIILQHQNAHETICGHLQLPINHGMDISDWREKLADRWDRITENIRIVLIGKYTGLQDAYLSIIKALQHACLAAGLRLDLSWVEASNLEDSFAKESPEKYEKSWKTLKSGDGILVPGGFGSRGVEGKILAAKYARENNIPYLGICLGMQTAVIEFARNVLGLAGANSTEFDPATPHPTVVFMPEGSTTQKGGTMRLGSRPTVLQTVDCMAAKLYQADCYINERHRHRYEVNPALVEQFERKGLKFVGRDETGSRMEIAEITGSIHPYFVAVQFHPEFKSRPNRPAPLFLGFILAAVGRLDAYFRGVAVGSAYTMKLASSADNRIRV